MISRRLTHLEPSHRADKPLLCLGHLEGRSRSLCCTPHTSPERRRRLTWSRVFHTLTSGIYSGGRAEKVAVIVKRLCYGALRNLEGIQAIPKAVLVILQRFQRAGITVQRGAACCSAEVLCKDQLITGKKKKKFCLIIQMRMTFSAADSIQRCSNGVLHILQNNCSRRNCLKWK